jgi:hypothetical protein
MFGKNLASEYKEKVHSDRNSGMILTQSFDAKVYIA